MMKRLQLSLLATTCSLILTACSSSSGGGGGTTPVYFTERPDAPSVPQARDQNGQGKDEQDTLDKNKQAPKSDNVAKLDSNLFQKNKIGRLTGAIMNINEQTVNAHNLSNYDKEPLSVLLLDGSEIQLNTQAAEDEQAGFNPIKAIDLKTGSLGTISGAVSKTGLYEADTRTYQFVRFGVVNVNNQSNLFVQGLQTPVQGIYPEEDNGHATLYSIPKSGIFVYNKGDALYGKDGTYSALSANIKADFTNNKLDVSLKDATQVEKVKFSAEIDGNSFYGNSQGIESKGAFYGSRANQVGGVFYEEKSGYNGVFGATDKRVSE